MAVTTAGWIVDAQGPRTAYARLRRIVAALLWQWAEASLLSDPIAYSYSSRTSQRGSAGRNGDGDDAESEFTDRDDDVRRMAFDRDARGRRLTGTPAERAVARFRTVVDGGTPLGPDQASELPAGVGLVDITTPPTPLGASTITVGRRPTR